MKITYGRAQFFAMGGIVGLEYFSVSDIWEPRNEELTSPEIWHVSHPEAAGIMAWLIETYGRDKVIQSLSTSPEDFESVYGLPFPEAYQKWLVWNTQKCVELGLSVAAG